MERAVSYERGTPVASSDNPSTFTCRATRVFIISQLSMLCTYIHISAMVGVPHRPLLPSYPHRVCCDATPVLPAALTVLSERERERERVCVCVCVREGQRKRQREPRCLDSYG